MPLNNLFMADSLPFIQKKSGWSVWRNWEGCCVCVISVKKQSLMSFQAKLQLLGHQCFKLSPLCSQWGLNETAQSAWKKTLKSQYLLCSQCPIAHRKQDRASFSKEWGTLVHKGHRSIQICFIFNVLTAKRQNEAFFSKECWKIKSTFYIQPSHRYKRRTADFVWSKFKLLMLKIFNGLNSIEMNGQTFS